MADKIFDDLKKKVEKTSWITESIAIRISQAELDILAKKADVLKMKKEDLLREYILNTSAFDGSVFSEKKTKNKVSEVEK